MGAPRTRAITAALMLAIGVAACAADDDTSAPGDLPSVEPAAPSEGADWPAEAPEEAADKTPWFEAGPPAEAPKEAAEETPGFEAGPPAEPAKEYPDASGSPAAEPEEEEEEAPEADRE
jgi:hypothetical protein